MNQYLRYFAICYIVGLLGLLGATLDLTERYVFQTRNKQITNSRRSVYHHHVTTCNH